MVSISDTPHKKLLLAQDIHTGIDRHRTGLKLLDHDLDRARQIMSGTEYLKFAVVRDPFARLVSAYLEKFVVNRFGKPNQHHTGPVIAAVQDRGQPDFRRGITFAQFIKHITSQPPESLDPHWKPQVLYLQGIHYDRVYRMDQLDVLCRELATRVGSPILLEKRNTTQKCHSRFLTEAFDLHADELKKPHRIDKRSFLDSELMCAIARYFADDYRLFLEGVQKGESPVAHPPPSPGRKSNDAPPAPLGVTAARGGSERPTSSQRDTGARRQTLRRPLLPTDTLFFLHLPKCGGTTFNGLLHQMFRRDSELYRNPYRRRELLDIRRDELRLYRLIRGHFQYPDIIDKLGFQPRTVTLLRNPIERFISHYQMCKHPRWQSKLAAQQDFQVALNSMSFEEFLERPDLTAELANLQYRFLAGFHKDAAGRPVCDYSRPCEGLLDHFEVVGLLERFDESLEAFCFVFDLPPITGYDNRNVSPDRDERSRLSPEVFERVAELNRHDMQLYATAQQKFERQRRQMRRELKSHPAGLPMLEEPQETLCLDMSRVPPGNNWWDSAEHPRFGCVRWTGPGSSANLYLPLTPGSKNVRLTVIDAAGEDILRSLKLIVEGHEVPLTCESRSKRFPRIFTGTLPAHAVRTGLRTKLSLQVSETRRPKKNHAKKFGIRVSSLEVSPAKADTGWWIPVPSQADAA
jgi:hypothetical protein